ncbi:AI-2E family transporter [Patescibacteria group bacterium]|nr:AI-2E family transporter [Patescibacteria group bacterium]
MNSEHIASNFFLALAIVATALVVLIFLPYLNAIILAIVFAILFGPTYRELRRLFAGNESIAAVAAVILAIVIVLVPLVFFAITVFGEAQSVYLGLVSGNSPQIATLVHAVNKILPSVSLDFGQYAKSFLNWLLANIGPIFSQVAGITLTFFLSAFTLYYLLKDSQKIHEAIVKISPLKHDDTEKILDKLYKMASSAVRGSLVMAVVQGVFIGIGFYLFGLPNPVLWGATAMICALVPLIGVAIVVLPTVVIVWLSGNVGIAIGFAIWGLVLPGLIDDFLRPKLIDRGTNISQLLILFSVIGGITVLGPLGFILGPLALSLFLTLIEIYPSVFKKPGGEA